MNKDRFFSSAVMITLSAFAVLSNVVFIIVMVALTIGGLYEFFYLIKKKGIPIYSYTGIAIGALIPIATYMQFEPTKRWELLLIVAVFVTIFILQLSREDNENAIVGISTTLFGVLYVSWLFSYLIKIRLFLPGVEGMKLLAFILLVTKMGDIGALLIGSRYGKHPMLPRVSPNKTIEGSIGSFVFSSLTAVIVQSFLPAQLDLALWQIIFFGAFFGGLGQLGDISESLIKRDCQVKDSGKMLPALGGVLDSIDSLLFSAPAFYFCMSYLVHG